MKRRLLVLVAVGAFAAVAIAPTVGADPTNAKNVQELQAICDTQTVTVVVIGNGEFTPAHLTGDSTSVFIPTAFDITSTFTPTGGSTETEKDMSRKAAPQQNTITCEIPFQSFDSPFGTFTIEGSVTGFLTPR
jgi:hypothetical protein